MDLRIGAVDHKMDIRYLLLCYGATMPTPRLYFLDNLRAWVVLLVIVLHGSMTYMAYAPTWWYVLDPKHSEFFTWLVLLLDVPIMPGLFFIAGYFALSSLQKKGSRQFLKDKLVRVALPWIFGVVCLAPLITYMIYFSRGVPMGFLEFWRTDFMGKLYQQSVYWFLGVLLLLFVLLAWVYEWGDRLHSLPRIVQPTGKVWAAFGGLIAAGFFIISLSFGPDDWWHNYVIVYQPVRVPLYIGYFVLGIYAYRRGWFTPGGYKPEIGPWGWAAVLSGLAYLAYRWNVANTPDSTILIKIGMALLFNAFCFAAVLAGAALFQQKANSAGRVWSSLAANSYGIYYFHPLILFPLAYLIVSLDWPVLLKAAIIILLTIGLAWGLAALVLKRVPFLREMF